MRLYNWLINYLLSSQTPNGIYTGSKTIFGESINGIVNVKDTKTLDFSITGDFTLDCKDEAYSMVDDEILLSNINVVGDCTHDALVDNKITLEEIIFIPDTNEIVVSVKYALLNLDIVLTKEEEISFF